MLVQSGNDATIALAEKVGGTEAAFAQIMNTYAKRLGLNGDQFRKQRRPAEPQSLHDRARHGDRSRAPSCATSRSTTPWYGLREFTWNNITQHNRNGLLLRDPTVDGIKTGHTDSAGYCLITSAKRGGMRLTSVVLGSPSIKAREDASAALLNYGYTFYETGKVKSRGELILQPCRSTRDAPPRFPPDRPPICTSRWAARPVRECCTRAPPPNSRSSRPSPRAPPSASSPSTAPGRRRRHPFEPLVALSADPAGGLWTRMTDSVALWFK
jgi:D-alanyl-D-alanine carboxypeptidase (penicillin-binding protein 5/6)